MDGLYMRDPGWDNSKRFAPLFSADKRALKGF